MDKKESPTTIHRIRLFDGYHGERIWKQPKNHSVYYDSEVDKQCRVPIRSRDEILSELGIF